MSPLIVQLVVVAVSSRVRGLNEVDGDMSTLRYSDELVSWIVLPIENQPELASGPRTGAPSTKEA